MAYVEELAVRGWSNGLAEREKEREREREREENGMQIAWAVFDKGEVQVTSEKSGIICKGEEKGIERARTEKRQLIPILRWQKDKLRTLN